MSRGLNAGNLSSIAQPHIRPIKFRKFEFDSGTLYTHSGVGTYDTLGQTWTGIGAVLEVSAIEEGIDLSPFGVTFKLNALNAELLAIATGEEVFNRRLTQYNGYLDENGALVADPQERWSGSGDYVSIRLGLENEIALQAESDMRFFDQANGSLFTDEEQQRLYSGDIAFQFMPALIDGAASLTWGGVTSGLGVPRTPRGPGPGAPRTRTPGNTPGR